MLQEETAKLAPDDNEETSSGINAPLINRLLFAHLTVNKSDGRKKLILDGNRVFLRRGKRLRDDDIADLLIFLRENARVVELDLSRNEIQCDGFIDIVNYIITTSRDEIVRLDVRNNLIESRGIKHLCKSGDKLRLKSLGLSGNKFGVQASKELALMLLNNPYLRELDVARVHQTASSLVYFVSVLRCDQSFYNDTLKILNMSSPDPECMYYFDSAHFGCLIGSMLKNNKCLERLHLGNFRFTCHDIELMLAEGKFNATLLSLDLSANGIGDLGAEILADWLAEKPALTSLRMARNIVTSTGALAFSRGLPFSRIKYFDISHNRIQDCGIKEILNTIKKSPCVRNLRIFGNCIGHDSSKIIHRMLLSGVLLQENIDARPYKIGREWKCARYTLDDWANH